MEKQRKKSKVLAEFKEFISRGSVVDLAVGVIIGSAFTAIVNSFVNDLVMPLVGFLIGGVKFEDLKVVLSPAVEDVSEEVALRYGAFLQRAIDFLLIALVVFLLVKGINTFRKRAEEKRRVEKIEDAPVPEPEKESEEVLLLAEIRDLLKKNGQSK